jgi:hypothetical protein
MMTLSLHTPRAYGAATPRWACGFQMQQIEMMIARGSRPLFGQHNVQNKKVRGEPRTSVCRSALLVDSRQRGIQTRDVGSQVSAVSACVFIRAVGLECVVATDPIIELDKPSTSGVLREQIAGWPR